MGKIFVTMWLGKRQTRATIKDGGGDIVMIYAEAADFGNAPEIFLGGISRVQQIGPGTIRVTFYSSRDEGNVVVLHVIWDMARWEQVSALIDDARCRLKHGPRPTAADSPHREAH